MSKIKTTANKASVKKYINNVENEQRKTDALELLKMFSEITGLPAKMWGTSLIGFGSYHYKSERSTQEGDWPLLAFSPRKQSLSIYIMPGFDNYAILLKKLGKHKTSVGCLYINKLADVDKKILKQLAKRSFLDMRKKHKIK